MNRRTSRRTTGERQEVERDSNTAIGKKIINLKILSYIEKQNKTTITKKKTKRKGKEKKEEKRRRETGSARNQGIARIHAWSTHCVRASRTTRL